SDPSGLTMAICTSSPSTSSTCTTPSRSGSIVYSSPSVTRYTFPCACQREDVIGDLARRAVGIDHNDAGDASHPFALIRGVATRARDDRGRGLVGRQARDLVEAERLACRRRDRPGERV